PPEAGAAWRAPHRGPAPLPGLRGPLRPADHAPRRRPRALGAPLLLRHHGERAVELLGARTAPPARGRPHHRWPRRRRGALRPPEPPGAALPQRDPPRTRAAPGGAGPGAA